MKIISMLFFILIALSNFSYAENIYSEENFIKITSSNQAEYHFDTKIKQNEYQKNCVNVIIQAPQSSKKNSKYAYSGVSIKKDGKYLLSIRPSSYSSADTNKIQFMVDKDQLKFLSIEIIYQVLRENRIDSEEYIYKIDLQSYIN